jgi:hypothetical protein
MKFLVETFDDYLQRLTRELRADELQELWIGTMNLFARHGSLVYDFLDAMTQRAGAQNQAQKNYRVAYDAKYTNRMAVMSDGHYTFLYSPWDPHLWRKKIEPQKIKKQVLAQFHPVLIDLPQRFFQATTVANPWKKLRSLPFLQLFAASHLKASVTKSTNGGTATTVSTGELNSDGRQNNLALTLLDNPKAHRFVKMLLTPSAKVHQQGWDSQEIAPQIHLVADYGNYGRPSQLPHLHELAEKMIAKPIKSNVAPTEILFISQYVPVGKMLRALNRAAQPTSHGGHGAKVLLTLEPDGDYRRSEIGFRILSMFFNRKRHPNIQLRTLEKPSHIKCLIVRYTDHSLSMIFGSDNFDSTADRFYRNTELSIFIDHVTPDQDGHKIITAMLDKLTEIGDISQNERKMFR